MTELKKAAQQALDALLNNVGEMRVEGAVNILRKALNGALSDEQKHVSWQPITTAPTDGSRFLTRTTIGNDSSIREAFFSGLFDNNGSPLFRVPITNNLCCAQEWAPICEHIK